MEIEIEIDSSIEEYISVIEKQIKGSMQYIRNNNWSLEENVVNRTDLHALQSTMTTRNMAYALNLFKLATKNGMLRSKLVRETVKTLLEATDIYRERYNKYFDQTDFEKILEQKNSSLEMKLQSDMTKTMLSLESGANQLSSIGDNPEASIATFNNIPIPLSMREAVEKKHPEIIETLSYKKNNNGK